MPHRGLMFADSLPNVLLARKRRYCGHCSTIGSWVSNGGKQYMSVTAEQLEAAKSSDTIFVLGGSESINDITNEQWDVVRKHDSIGMNWWPLHDFVPTYYHTNYPQDRLAFEHFVDILSPRLARYSNTIFAVSGDRAVRRGMHPRVFPKLFPQGAKCWFYNYPQPLETPQDGEFKTSDFADTVYYRGGLTLVLHLINLLGYKRIVLLGVDLVNRVHFYDHYPEMQWQFESGYSEPVDAKREMAHGTMVQKGPKLPAEVFLKAVYKHYYQPNGTEVFIGSTKSVLYPEIPAYEFGV